MLVLERETRVELATLCLGSRCSTTELVECRFRNEIIDSERRERTSCFAVKSLLCVEAAI